ncbi:antibiotic biosynthesis monooxygenase [Paenibacillus sacheonensis]|uniref:Antibiotic biosynthesis monooxygenase n=1 Tax=Paenibacillus sacheonensis TaxID=742054 RepID=A0A7X4YP69_9BACL|nr:antibiotic biosynthesis monooxygenase [Paenibacillus sacheonensis]MBM7565238.1 heme-degrading monooxygenase HmoA [Paenibacillus sacheonensis]NBC69986.1 antibiotic biosynthesis monooxygenase [Paenibacillus sacheonensis]
MIIVENRFEVRAGASDAVLERFRSPKGVHAFPGFIRMDVLHAALSEEAEEIRVCTAWENEEAFKAWTESDSFRQAHARRGGPPEGGQTPAPAGSGHQAQGNGHASAAPQGSAPASPILSSKVTTYNVVATHLPASSASA